MTLIPRQPVARLVLLAATVLVLAGPVHARNDTFMQPVADAMRHDRAREVVGTMPVRFGADTALPGASPELAGADVLVEGISAAGGDDPRHHENLDDEQRCVHAFDDALAKLVAAARAAGGAALVGVVSDYKGTARINDGRLYECHAGGVRSYVWLRAQVARQLVSASSAQRAGAATPANAGGGQ